MPILNLERLEAWLFAQPKERQFDYLHGHRKSYPGCLMCNHLRDSGYDFYAVLPHTIWLDPAPAKRESFEGEIAQFMKLVSSELEVNFTAGDAQQLWTRLFGPVHAQNPTQDAPEPVSGADMVAGAGRGRE